MENNLQIISGTKELDRAQDSFNREAFNDSDVFFNRSALKLERHPRDPRAYYHNQTTKNPLTGDMEKMSPSLAKILQFSYTPYEEMALALLGQALYTIKDKVSVELQQKYRLFDYNPLKDPTGVASFVHHNLRVSREEYVTYSNLKPSLEEITNYLEETYKDDKGIDLVVKTIKLCLNYIRK